MSEIQSDNFGSGIVLKLTTKGYYVWSVSLPLKDGTDAKMSVEAIKKIDSHLKDVFPNHAKIGTGKFASTDFLDEV